MATKSEGNKLVIPASISPLQQMISSCTGAIVTSLFVTPLDVVKIRLQAQRKEFLKHKCFLYCNGLMDHLCYCVNGNGNGYAVSPTNNSQKWYKRPGHFNGTLDAFVKISRTEGIKSLWSGLPPTLVMAVPATVVYFTLYDQLRHKFHLWSGSYEQPIWVPMLAGSGARVLAVTVISPLELVRTKMQSKRLSYLELGIGVKQLVETKGIFSLWRGLGPTLLRDVPFSTVYWSIYETLKNRFDQQKPTVGFSFCAGAFAGTISAIVTTPFDVVKTHRQIELGEMEALKETRTLVPTYRLLIDLYQSQGINSIFTGLVPRIVKIAPACAIMISTYEFGKTFFSRRKEEEMKK